MNPERWQRIQQLFEDALNRPEASRTSFVESRCEDDLELRDQVISLLAAHDRAGDVEDTPAAWITALAGRKSEGFHAGARLADRYRIERLLGRGGMGEVYEALDEDLAIPVALKTLTFPGGADEALRRLKLESLLARSVWHPNVCRVYDVGQHREGDATVWFLTMELLHGETLAERLNKEGRLALDVALRLAEQMAAGLGAAHRAGVVHCDFKPGNVLLVRKDGGEQAVVTDFGTARAASQQDVERDASSVVHGTPAYMSPEQFRGDEVGPATDVYALGLVLYEMTTGTLPFTGESAREVAMRRLKESPPSPRRIVPELDDRWETAILRALALEPSQRFRRPEELIEALTNRTGIAVLDGFEPGVRERHALPTPRDAFVGRAAEIATLGRELHGGARLVTLTGVGGMGKTRLAVHYGRLSLDEWQGGVWFFDLTEARDASAIAATVAVTLGIHLGRGDPIAQLGHAIAGRGKCLLVFDNFEQVATHAAATLGRWLKQACDARCLVTSRERLGLDGEHVHGVDPLSTQSAFELFTARARALRPALDLVGDEAEAAREIVRLVDGMPLAIELAAARMRVMSATQIVSAMRKRFRLLTGGRSAHHETLEGTIDLSWELLTPWERRAWAQCSVFEGGFTLAAAEGVLDLGDEPETPWVVDVLRALLDKSLLRIAMSEAGALDWEPRFGMFLTLQEYARAKLDELGGVVAEERHAAWFAQLGTDEALEQLDAPGGTERWRRLVCELENLVAGCQRAKTRGDGATTAAIHRALWGILKLRGPFDTVIELGREILRDVELGGIDAARTLHTVGEAEIYSGNFSDADEHLREAVRIAREVGHRRLEGRALAILGRLYHEQGRPGDARPELLLALEIAREAGDRRNEAIALNMLGMIHHLQGEIEPARTFHEAALVVARDFGDRRTEGVTLSNLGILQQNLGNTDQGRDLYEEALAIHREVGNRRSEGIAHLNLGSLMIDQGRMAEARAHLEAALAIDRDIGARCGEGIALAALGELLSDQERNEEARGYFEAALVVQREVGDRSSEGVVLWNLGRLLHREGKINEAHIRYQDALAMHREVGSRRYEGIVLTSLATLLAPQDPVASRDMLRSAEIGLREIEARMEVAKLLCVRAEFEWHDGDSAAARASLEEARTIAIEVGSGPESELACMLDKARRVVEASP